MPATLQTPAPTSVAKDRKTTGTQSPGPATRMLHSPVAAMEPPALRLSPPLALAAASEGGRRLYRTSAGNVVELPPDMTVEEAAGLEADAKAAQTQLGKGPAPKPVPDVKKLAKKEEKKARPKPEARGKRDDTGRGKAAPRAGAAATAPLKAVSTSKVAQYLAVKGTPVLLKGIGMLQKLKQNEQTHDDAAEKLKQSEKAVVIPSSEGQSKSNAGQVNTVSGRPTPTADANKAKQKLQESLQANIPQSIEAVDNFKRDKKAQHMGADVMTVVQDDKSAVVSTFSDMEQTPPPTPPEHTPEALPPEEVAPPTANMNLGQGAIAPLQKEHTDVSHYTKEADCKLKEEGVTQEQLDMVDSGDLAAANKEKKGMEATAKTEPLAVQKFAQQETDKVDKDLQQEEKQARDGLKAKHKADLGATTQKQKGAKSALEKKRDEVAIKINGIFTAAQDKVKKKLTDLETQSMKRFDDGNAQATKAFEDNVKRELDAYKAERYSGFWGDLKRAKDWLLGMDGLPAVKAIFERNRAIFVSTINKLVEDISADNKRVIQECKDELANAKKTIKECVDKLSPALKDIVKKDTEDVNAKLDGLDRFVAKKEQELQNKLKDKQQAAIKAIDEKIEKMKEAMAGALAKLGKLLLLAAKKFFTWALQKFGYSLAEIEGIINKGAAVLKAIFTKPIQFVKNLVNAASTGFKNFGKNFLTHLKDAIFDWLTGSLEGIQLPSSWDLKGIASVALQMLGLTWQNIRGKLVKHIGEPAMKAMETGFDLVVTLVKDGPMAAWEKIKEMANDIKEAFIEGVKDFIKIKIIQKAIETVISLFIPGVGIIRAIVAIYDTIVFFIQKAKQIAQMVGNFLSSIGEIAMGNIGAAANALEKGLATALKLVINFLAKILRLDGITAKIRNAIEKLRKKVDSILDKVVNWIVEKAKQLFAKVFGKKDKSEAVPVDLRDRAGQLVLQRVGGEHTEEEIQRTVAQVRDELRPQGLQRLDFTAPTEEGEASLIAQASAPKTVAKRRKKDRVRKVSVVMRAKLVFDKDALQAIEEGRQREGEKPLMFSQLRIPGARSGPVPGVTPGTQEAALVGSPFPREQHRHGTVLLRPSSGSVEAQVISWSSGFPVADSNASHAERYFDEWFSQAQGKLRGLKELHISINYSPCSLCVGTLPSFKGTHVQASLSYQIPYKGKDRRGLLASNTTTVEDLNRLRGKGWTVTGLEPEWTDAKKERERKASKDILERPGP